MYLPVGGTITAINESIEGNEAVVNESPQDDGWFVKIQIADQSELDDLLDAVSMQCVVCAVLPLYVFLSSC